MPASRLTCLPQGNTRIECIPWKDPSVPHRINSLICLAFGLCLWTQSAQAQSSIPRPTGGARPAPKKSLIPAAGVEVPATSVPRIARPPVGRAVIEEEPAETAEPQPVRGIPKQGAMQGPIPRQPAMPGPAPQVAMQPIPPGMKQLLLDWEAKTDNIKSLSCPITRIEFDKVFATETRSKGKVFFENPDRGRIDFEPADEALLMKPGRVDEKGKPYKVSPGASAKWICTGKMIYVLDVKNKSYDLIEIPPQMQGQNITRSPLPFIFGMKAQDAMQRFALRFGQFHNPQGNKVGANGKPLRPALHIIANPIDPNVAKEYIEAEIIVDAETFLPMNLRTLDPAGNKETVYSFNQAELKIGAKWINSPFSVTLPGWQLMRHHKAEPELQAENTPK